MKQHVPETTKISFDYEQEKEKYDNLISDKDIQIEKENFEGGYHETIFLKSMPYDKSQKNKIIRTNPQSPSKFPIRIG
jgi:hypothetical protein